MPYYSTLARVKRHMGTENNSTDINSRLADLIMTASAIVERESNRRFDRRYETRRYTPRQTVDGGDLVGRKLTLDADLLSVVELVNGDDQVVAPGSYDLLPDNAAAFDAIELVENLRWSFSGRAARKIRVNGLWGYGGEWVSSGAALSAPLPAPVSLVPVTEVGALEQHQLIRIDDEFMTISAPVDESPLTVSRGVNGSQAVLHNDGATVEVFVPHELVMRAVDRLAMWLSELDENPSGRAVRAVGDFARAIDITATPEDAQALIQLVARHTRIRPV